MSSKTTTTTSNPSMEPKQSTTLKKSKSPSLTSPTTRVYPAGKSAKKDRPNYHQPVNQLLEHHLFSHPHQLWERESAVLERTRHPTPLHHLKQETAEAGRPGLLLTSNKRLISHMNEATKTANELLLREKEALEGAGKIKREKNKWFTRHFNPVLILQVPSQAQCRKGKV